MTPTDPVDRLERARRRLAKELAAEGVAITPRLRVATAER